MNFSAYLLLSAKGFRANDKIILQNLIKTQKQSLFELLVDITKLPIFCSEYLQDFNEILFDLIALDAIISTEVSLSLADIFERLHNMDATRELVFLCEVVLEK